MPIRNFENVPGEMFQALEEAGHGSRIIVADRSFDIDRRKQLVVGYRGPTSDAALSDCLRLVPVDSGITIMDHDKSDTSDLGQTAALSFLEAIKDAGTNYGAQNAWANMLPRLSEDALDGTGFYDLIRDSGLIERQVVIRTPDPRPYACATFIVGHSQFGE